MEFIQGMEFVDIYLTDYSIYVLERLVELRDAGEYSDVRNIIFDSKNRDDANKRIIKEQESVTFNQLTDVRVSVDETVRDTIRFLGNVVGFVKIREFDLIINMIVAEWVREEDNKRYDIVSSINNINFATFGEMSYIELKVRRDLWDRLKEIGKHRGLNKEECIKMAIIRFLENRYDVCREILM
jgi:hypothetical protein